jgi:hypothetical protein
VFVLFEASQDMTSKESSGLSNDSGRIKSPSESISKSHCTSDKTASDAVPVNAKIDGV